MFELYENTSDVRVYYIEDIYPGCSLDVRDTEPKLIRTFNSLDDALTLLKQYKTDTTFLRSTSKFETYLITEYYIEDSLTGDIIKISE